METSANTNPNKAGRPFGMTNLTEETKASIVAAKNLHIFSHQRIAQDHNVSRQTVVNLTEDKLKPETRATLEAMTKKLGRMFHKVADRIEEKLDRDDFKDGVYPQLLTAIHNAKRLEEGLSTSNIAILDVAQIINKSLQTAAKLHRADPNEPLPNRAEIVENYVQLCARNGVEPDESLIDFSVIETVDNP